MGALTDSNKRSHFLAFAIGAAVVYGVVSYETWENADTDDVSTYVNFVGSASSVGGRGKCGSVSDKVECMRSINAKENKYERFKDDEERYCRWCSEHTEVIQSLGIDKWWWDIFMVSPSRQNQCWGDDELESQVGSVRKTYCANAKELLSSTAACNAVVACYGYTGTTVPSDPSGWSGRPGAGEVHAICDFYDRRLDTTTTTTTT